MQYKNKYEAKEWAWENMKGVVNVIMPSFSSDLKQLNEAGIRHDLRLCIEHGFEGTLLVSECGTTVEEYKRFIEICADEAKGRIQLIGQASFNSMSEMIDVLKFGEKNGLDSYLLAFPSTFYPTTAQEIYEFIRDLNENIDLGCIVFPAMYWNFGRIHPSGWPPELSEAVADIPNVIAFKYESIGNATPGMLELWKKVGKKVIVSDPFDANTPLWVETIGMQWLGTSQYEYFGDLIPKMFKLLKEGHWEEGMKLYWQMHPGRMAKSQDKNSWVNGSNFLHRYMWKYMGWLNGYNGGPLRMPVMRPSDGQFKLVREGLIKSGIKPTDLPDSQFFIGRHPM